MMKLDLHNAWIRIPNQILNPLSLLSFVHWLRLQTYPVCWKYVESEREGDALFALAAVVELHQIS